MHYGLARIDLIDLYKYIKANVLTDQCEEQNPHTQKKLNSWSIFLPIKKGYY